MTFVKQEDPMGCGIACVAFVLGISYKEATKLLTLPEKRKTLGIAQVIYEKLSRGGSYDSFSRYVGRLDDTRVEIGDIVYVKKCKMFPSGHYLVKINGGYMDPFINMGEVVGDYTRAKAGKRFPLKERITMITRKGVAI
jgi:hypothetical protein